jgi:hypothetical protein
MLRLRELITTSWDAEDVFLLVGRQPGDIKETRTPPKCCPTVGRDEVWNF